MQAAIVEDKSGRRAIAARAYKYSIGQPFVSPRNELDFASNFLRMCFAVPAEDYELNKTLAKAMDKIFILHADHEQNASTSTVRLAGSCSNALANPKSATHTCPCESRIRLLGFTSRCNVPCS